MVQSEPSRCTWWRRHRPLGVDAFVRHTACDALPHDSLHWNQFRDLPCRLPKTRTPFAHSGTETRRALVQNSLVEKVWLPREVVQICGGVLLHEERPHLFDRALDADGRLDLPYHHPYDVLAIARAGPKVPRTTRESWPSPARMTLLPRRVGVDVLPGCPKINQNPTAKRSISQHFPIERSAEGGAAGCQVRINRTDRGRSVRPRKRRILPAHLSVRDRSVRECREELRDQLRFECFSLGVSGGAPGDQELFTVCQLPDVSPSPLADGFAGAVAAVFIEALPLLASTRPAGVGLADLQHHSARHPCGSELRLCYGRVPALESAGRAHVQECRLDVIRTEHGVNAWPRGHGYLWQRGERDEPFESRRGETVAAPVHARSLSLVRQPDLRGSSLGFRNLANYIARSLLKAGKFRPRLHPGFG